MLEDAKNDANEFVHNRSVDDIVILERIGKGNHKFLNDGIALTGNKSRHKQTATEARITHL